MGGRKLFSSLSTQELFPSSNSSRPRFFPSVSLDYFPSSHFVLGYFTRTTRKRGSSYVDFRERLSSRAGGKGRSESQRANGRTHERAREREVVRPYFRSFPRVLVRAYLSRILFHFPLFLWGSEHLPFSPVLSEFSLEKKLLGSRFPVNFRPFFPAASCPSLVLRSSFLLVPIHSRK